MRSTKKTNQKSKIKYQNKQSKKISFKKQNFFLILSGIIFLLFGFLIFFLTFYPVVKEEIKYQIVTKKKFPKLKEIKPVDGNFGIVIPKIAANAKVIANVDPFDEKVYQKALTQGVAHAKGTQLPDQAGNTFIFAHSSTDWYTANRYNSVFYLLNKLEKDDDIFIFYQKQKYHFQVVEKKIVDPSEINYLKGDSQNKILTLMTCWPPGTNLKRLILLAKLVKIN
jgi:sortase A